MRYPGLVSMPGHAVARQQMHGFGGMLALEIAGPSETATAVVDNLRLFLNAPSLGGVESLATQPAVTSHAGLGPDERRRRGIGDSLVRLSIGLEDADDLIADLEQALEAAGRPPGGSDGLELVGNAGRRSLLRQAVDLGYPIWTMAANRSS